MRRPSTIWVTASVLMSFAIVARTAAATESGRTNRHSEDVKLAYPETADGLKAMVGELFTAEKANDDTRSQLVYATLAIPEHEQWFRKTFGKEEGARLEAKYVSSNEAAVTRLKKLVRTAVEQDRMFLNVQIFQTPDDTSIALAKAVLSTMKNPTAIYDVGNATGPDDKSPYFFGYFVFVDGGFRYVDLGVLRALSTAPPLRIRVGGAVQHARLVNSVQPEYPEEAKKAGIEGTVKLHVILTKDGGIEQIQVVSGQPLLVKAALDAVRFWRYQPTLLNGEAVEVDTTIDVVFQLKN